MQLTPHFRLEEFTRSDAAAQLGLDNTPPAEHLANLHVLALGMEMVRKILRVPVLITSGYRAPAVNAAVKGSKTSAHAKGYAADFHVRNATAFSVADSLVGRLPYDQLIYEPSRKIVHISFDPRLRGEVMTQRGGPGTPFEQGLVL